MAVQEQRIQRGLSERPCLFTSQHPKKSLMFINTPVRTSHFSAINFLTRIPLHGVSLSIHVIKTTARTQRLASMPLSTPFLLSRLSSPAGYHISQRSILFRVEHARLLYDSRILNTALLHHSYTT